VPYFKLWSLHFDILPAIKLNYWDYWVCSIATMWCDITHGITASPFRSIVIVQPYQIFTSPPGWLRKGHTIVLTRCASCGKMQVGNSQCSHCHQKYYCVYMYSDHLICLIFFLIFFQNRECQIKHWKEHKKNTVYMLKYIFLFSSADIFIII